MNHLLSCRLFWLPVALGIATASCATVTHPHNAQTVRIVCVLACAITVPDPAAADSVQVYTAKSLGLMVSGTPGTNFSLGYSNSLVTLVPKSVPDSLVELSARPGEWLRLKTTYYSQASPASQARSQSKGDD